MAANGQQQRASNPEAGDTLVRFVLHPRQLSNSTGCFALEAAFDLVKFNSKAKVCECALSTGLLRAIGETFQLHEYGCRSAQYSRDARYKRNEKTGKIDLNPRLPHYIGFYTFVLGRLQSIEFKDASVEVVQATENGEKAHCNVILKPNKDIDRGKWSDARTAFYNAMGSIVSGPDRHICPVDSDLREELSMIDLPPVSN